MDKQKALDILKDWADKDFAMIKNDRWADEAYFPMLGKSVGALVGIVAGRDDFYFDDNEFVDGSRTIIVVKPWETTTGQFFRRLQELGII